MVPIKLAKPSVPMRVKLITATKIELILVPRHVACSRYKAASNRLGRSNQLQTHEMITAQCHLHCITGRQHKPTDKLLHQHKVFHASVKATCRTFKQRSVVKNS